MTFLRLVVLALTLLGSNLVYAYCSVPLVPYSGASAFTWRSYQQDLNRYQQCMYQQQEEAIRDLQRQQQRRLRSQNGGLLNNSHWQTW